MITIKKIASYALHYRLAGTLLSAVLWCPMHAHTYYEEGRNIDALFENVSYLDLSEETRSIIEQEYKKGTFNTIEGGFHRTILEKDEWKITFYMFLLCVGIGAFVWLEDAERIGRQHIDPDLLPVLLMLATICVLFLFLTYHVYVNARKAKDCWLITDTGCLAMDHEGMVFLKYKNLLDVAFINEGTFGLYNRRFARIISQKGECFDFQPHDFLSFEAFDALFQQIKTKIEKERERQAKMEKANQSDLPQQDLGSPVRRYV